MIETFHVEALGYGDGGRGVPVVERLSLRTDNADRVRQRAVRLLKRSQSKQWDRGKVEAVRVVDGAGTEIFRWSVWDEMSGAAGR